ncbi:sensor histidine kinase [Winogradskyella bathintestinalis]|uniref:histidine kinase n=1 Tax=Winogradskyella bathintestinalis TaxID=3035208 RepID=A0ABT7ZV60_9FLAO|nr:HAMP domain-containing sensor histidine kinase [Winogradskyella bathintestinalis]MDN3492836.1 HAMP domain-containing sensor histidine kinase [Winogradskyella bathintestinalis]
MSTTEAALKERIKELTCLYEVSSIIANANESLLEDTLQAIGYSAKKGFQFPEYTDITIITEFHKVATKKEHLEKLQINAPIHVFNAKKGQLFAFLCASKFTEKDFLPEEQQLLNSIAQKIGNLLERIEIQNNETSLKRQMERADRLGILGEITAGIAHELNTPLANILGFAELLKDDLKASDAASQDVDKIIKNAIFSREVVKKLMFFACEMPQKMKRINLVPIIKNAIHLLEASFKKEKVKCVVEMDEDHMWLRADPIQLTQIIFNLLMNSIYFSPKNGLVTVKASQSNEEIIIKIIDQGTGFTKEALDKVFQPFFTTKPTGDGSGLGLSVVHGIVASHKGKITAANNTSQGAIFTVTLPKV